MTNNCPFCPLEHKTDWYYWRPWNDSFGDHEMIICKDLNDKGYKYRILAVDSTFHCKCQEGGISEGFRAPLEIAAVSVANAHIANGWVKEIAHIDTEHFQYPDHYHIQICLK